MKRILSLLLTLLMLLSLAACGNATQSQSSEPELQDPNAYLSDLFHGIYKLEERDGAYGEAKIGGGAFVPMRFSHERIADYEQYNKSAKIAAPYFNCTSGVRMDFYTDAAEISFRFSVMENFFDGVSDYPTDSFDIFEDGVYQTSIPVKHGANGTLTYARQSTEAESRITITFPNRHGISLSSISLGNTRPYTTYDHNILILGASCDQGLFADKPSDNYVDTVCRALNADFMNLSVGGEVYRAEAIDSDIPFDPDLILIDLDGNTFYSGTGESELPNLVKTYLDRLKTVYPDAKITVISSFRDNKPASWTQTLKTAALDSGAGFIAGAELVDQTLGNWNADKVHPNSKGFAQIAQNILPLIQEQL